MSIRFSVIVPVFNGACFLQHALDSLAGQERFDGAFETIVVDDGSTDGSRDILKTEMQRGRFALRVMEGAHRGNWVASTNKALREAQGDCIVFLHQDDGYKPSRLRRLAEVAETYPNCCFFVNTTEFVGADGGHLGVWRSPLKTGFCSPAECVPQLMVQDSFAVPGVMFRKSAFEQSGPLDEDYTYTADWEYWLRLALKYGVFFVDEILSEFRVHFGSQTVAIASQFDEMRRNLEGVLNRYLPDLMSMLPDNRKKRYRNLTRLGVETDLFLGMGGAHLPLPWGTFLPALFACTPLEWGWYVRYSTVVARTMARIRAGFLRRKTCPK